MRELLNKTNIANVVAGIVIILAAVYAAYTGDSKLLTFLAGAGTGYLFKRSGL